jgi:hypothetical protein
VKNLRFLILLILVVTLSAWAPAPQGLNLGNLTVPQTVAAPILAAPANASHVNAATSWMPTLTWKYAVVGSTYRLEISTSATDFSAPVYAVEGITGSGTITHKVATPLLPFGAKLYWHVRATTPDTSVSAYSAAWYFLNDPVPASLLTLPASGALLPVTINWVPTLTWTYPAKDATYSLDISKSADFTLLAEMVYTKTGLPGSATTTITHLVDTALPKNTRLYWRVKATIPGVGDSPYSLTRSFVTAKVPVPTLSLPANNGLLATAIGWKPTLTWKYLTAFQAAKFKLEIADSATFSNIFYTKTDIANTPTGIITHTVDADMPANKKLYWRVTASLDTDNSTPTTAFAFITQPRVVTDADFPFLPNGGDEQKAQRPNFSWGTSENVTTYSFQVAANSTFTLIKYSGVVTYTGSFPGEVAFTLPVDLPLNPLSNLTYYWRVAAKGTPTSTAVSAWSPTQSFTVPMVVPAVPVLRTPLTGASVTTYDVPFTWSTVTGTGITYNLQISKSATFPNTPDLINVSGIDGTTTSATLGTGLFYWRVQSKDGNGYLSNWSKAFTFKTPATFKLHVFDSLITDQGLPSAKVTISGILTGGLLREFTTDGNGDLTVPNIPAGTRTITVNAGGDYLKTTLSVPFAVGVTAEKFMYIKHVPITITLTWGKNIYNLDSHLWLPSTNPAHLYPELGMMGSTTAFPWAKLSGDAMGYTLLKTETFTLANRFPGKYQFAVVATDGDQLPGSDAKVTLYYNGVKWKEYFANQLTGANSFYWYVFSLDGATGVITDQNKMLSYAEVQSTFPYDQYGGYSVSPK